MSSLEMRLQEKKREALALTPMVAALDLGASKISCFVARNMGANAPLRIEGIGQSPARGIKNGAIIDIEAAERAVRKALRQAEEMAGAAVSEVVVSISGFGIRAERVRAELTMPVGIIGAKEKRKITSLALQNRKYEGRTIIHATPNIFRLDGQLVGDPADMIGRKLEVIVTIVTAPSSIWRNLMLCVERTNRHVSSVVAAPYASALAALNEDEMEAGALLVDMGARTTTAACFQRGGLTHIDAVPIGAEHITMDIVHCFTTTMTAAETLKIAHGSAIAGLNEEEQMIDAPRYAEDGNLVSMRSPRSLLTGIVRPRVEETLELLRDRLRANGIEREKYGRRIILSGGGAQLNGVRELAARIFEGHARIGRPQKFMGLADAVSGPAYTVCAGLLRWGVKQPQDYAKLATQQTEASHPILKAFNWFNENIWR